VSVKGKLLGTVEKSCLLAEKDGVIVGNSCCNFITKPPEKTQPENGGRMGRGL